MVEDEDAKARIEVVEALQAITALLADRVNEQAPNLLDEMRSVLESAEVINAQTP